jgi:type 1 fimbria pilin
MMTGALARGAISGGSIKDCQAVSGSAVYVGSSAVFSGELEVSGNSVSDMNSSAIQAADNGKLYFEGSVVVTDNTCSVDSTNKHDVLMQINGNTIINTTSNGLSSEASIGVYVSDPNGAYANHGKEDQPFGT